MTPLLLGLVPLALADPGSTLPNGHVWGCLPNNVSAHHKFCDHTLPTAERLADLVAQLSLEEKIGLMCADKHTHVDSCNMMSAGCLRLGIPSYMHLVETNTAVASRCLRPGKCSVNYPGPTGLGAAMNRTLWYNKGHNMGNEIRAFNNLRWYRMTGDAPNSLIGLNGYGPNLNIARDRSHSAQYVCCFVASFVPPLVCGVARLSDSCTGAARYGRTSELPGEDPFLTGTYAVNMVRGGQGMDEFESGHSKHLKMTLGLKHYALYTVEEPRPSFIPNVTAHDLWETYLPQYRLGFSSKDLDGKPAGHAMATMCSYAGENGVPSCANDYLLNQVVRSAAGFNRPDVVVGTDCGAVNNMVHANHYASSDLDAAAKTLNGGTDMELGDQTWSSIANGGKGKLAEAVLQKTANVSRIDESVTRIMHLRMITGQFDPIENQPYAKIGDEHINSTAGWQLNLEAALQSFVLLKNDGDVLPMKKGKKTAILGPHIHSTRDLMSDYKGDQQCAYEGQDWKKHGGGDYYCFPTIAQAFVRANGAANTVVSQGVEMDSSNSSGIAEAVAAAQGADQVLLFIGIGNDQEHEGIDRHNTSLPGLQEPFTLQVLAACKAKSIPVAVILINGGAVAIDPVVPAAPAIVEAFYPSVRGGEALTMMAFGETPLLFGKLPITLYDKHYIQQVDFHDFSMSKSPGRTYKYFSGTPLFSFGTGLTYAKHSVSCTQSLRKITCTVTNTGGASAADEVLMAYHSAGPAIRAAAKHPVPIKELVAFERVAVTSGSPVTVAFEIGDQQLGLVDETGTKQLVKGDHVVEISNGAGFSEKFTMSVSAAKVLATVPPMPPPK